MSTLVFLLCCYGYIVFIRMWALKPLPSVLPWSRLAPLSLTPRWITASYPTAIVIAVYVVLRTFFVDVTLVPSESMAPGIGRNSIWLINRAGIAFDYRYENGSFVRSPSLTRGDVVFFHAPQNPEVTLVKRLIGLPGDRIEIGEREISVNGRGLLRERTGAGILSVRGETKPVQLRAADIDGRSYEVALIDGEAWDHDSMVLGPNEYFVLGDNLDASEDSRYFGVVPGEYLLGTLLANVTTGQPFIERLAQ